MPTVGIVSKTQRSCSRFQFAGIASPFVSVCVVLIMSVVWFLAVCPRGYHWGAVAVEKSEFVDILN